MLQVKLDTGFNIEVDFTIIPFLRRFFAWVIDLTIIITYFIIGSRLLEGILLHRENVEWVWILFGLPPLFYHLLCETGFNGQSVGKKALGMRVIAADGGQPSISQYLIRWVFRLVDFPIWILASITYGALPWWCAIFLVAGLVSLIFTPYTQRIGDLVAGTIIISTRTHTSWEDTVFTELESNYRPRYPQVMNLSDKDINTLKSIIDTVRRKSDYDLSMRIGERIKAKLKVESDQDSLEFLVTLLKDYNYYSTR